MKVIGFNVDEINAKKGHQFIRSNISTDVTFNNVEKSKIEILKEDESIKIDFKFLITYKDADSKSNDLKNEVSIIGSLMLIVTKDESKDFIKSWKTKEIPKDKMLGLYNFILRKCSVKALVLEEDLNLQPHIPFPQVKAQSQKQNQ